MVLAGAFASTSVGLAAAAAHHGWARARAAVSPSNILFFSPTGVLRAVGSTLNIVVLRFVGPLNYIVLAQLRLSLTALLSHLCLEKKPSLLERQNIGVVTFCLVLFAFSDEGSSHGGGRTGKQLALGLILQSAGQRLCGPCPQEA